jgi:hypothetical protein
MSEAGISTRITWRDSWGGTGSTCVERDVAPWVARRREEAALRDAMAGMANAMACVHRALGYRRLLLLCAEADSASERPSTDWFACEGDVQVWLTAEQYRSLVSREWSAEVRRRAAEREQARRPRIACQGEED